MKPGEYDWFMVWSWLINDGVMVNDGQIDGQYDGVNAWLMMVNMIVFLTEWMADRKDGEWIALSTICMIRSIGEIGNRWWLV